MAEPNDSNTTDDTTAASSSENDSDKLDDMLNEAESSMDDNQEEDELIERLLVDDASADEKEAVETIKNEPDEFDEFAEENDDLEQSMQEIDANVKQPATESEAKKAVADDDFLMADFDISADDNASGDEQNEKVSGEAGDTGSEAETIKDMADVKEPVSAQSEEIIAKTEAEIDGLKAQINELWAENKTQQGQVEVLMNAVNSEEKYDSIIKEIGSIQTEQQKLKKSLKQGENKIPLINYIAIGIAVLALLVGGVLGGIGYGAKSEVADLSELFTTFEEEVGLFANKDSTVEIEKLNDKVILLTTEADQLKKQLLEIDQVIKSNSSQAGVAENKQLQQTVEQLLAKVTALEKRKFVSATKSRVVATKKVKTPTAKVSWVVNLVSFRQEWFAKRKASEFDGKGIATEVMPVTIKGEKWFRLRVVGFKSKYEAATYAVKAKKALNLSAVWVAKD